LALSRPLEPYDPENDLELKDILAEFKVVHKAIDEVVDKILNEAVDEVLNEE
jgi:DNA-binding FrmR family transcriptional regulator